MNKETWLGFFATGTLVLPLILLLGTGSMEAVAVALFALTMLQIMLHIVAPDDPLADPAQDEEEKS